MVTLFHLLLPLERHRTPQKNPSAERLFTESSEQDLEPVLVCIPQAEVDRLPINVFSGPAPESVILLTPSGQVRPANRPGPISIFSGRVALGFRVLPIHVSSSAIVVKQLACVITGEEPSVQLVRKYTVGAVGETLNIAAVDGPTIQNMLDAAKIE